MASLIYLGFSVVTFIITYGLLFLLFPAIVASFFSAFDPGELAPEWRQMFDDTTGQVRFLIPLIPTIGIFLIVLKVLLVASTRGSD